jgi:hypothetical protein
MTTCEQPRSTATDIQICVHTATSAHAPLSYTPLYAAHPSAQPLFLYFACARSAANLTYLRTLNTLNREAVYRYWWCEAPIHGSVCPRIASGRKVTSSAGGGWHKPGEQMVGLTQWTLPRCRSLRILWIPGSSWALGFAPSATVSTTVSMQSTLRGSGSLASILYETHILT